MNVPDSLCLERVKVCGIHLALGSSADVILLQSRYLTMPDGVRIAVDVLLPPALDGNPRGPNLRLPAVFIQCRYMRGLALR